jgi:heat shock protein HslJ
MILIQRRKKMKGKNKVLREILGIVIASFLMAMVMSVGSATELPASNFSLEGNTWTLTSFIEGEEVQSPIQNTTITVYFENGSIKGNAGCNGYFGDYTVDGNEINISNVLGTTMMYCGPEEVMQQEYQYHEMLGNVTTCTIEGNQLTLSTDGNVSLVYNATEAPEFDLEGNTWTLTSFIEGEDVQLPLVNTTITAYFEDGIIKGNAGCNGYSGGYTVDGNKINISKALVTTAMTCGPEEVMQQEYQYHEMLGNVTTYTIEGNQLTLSTDDNVTLVYNATEAPEFDLEGNTWTLISFIEGEEVQSPIQNTTITVYFEDGNITGNSGCNGYFGDYTVDGNEINISNVLGTTMMYCDPEEVMQQEAQYLEMLGNVTTCTIEEKQLTLSTEDNRTLVYQVEVEE